MQLKEENKIDERKKRGDMEEELRRKWKTLEVRGAWVRVDGTPLKASLP